MTNNRRMNVTVGFTVDKTSLSVLQKSLDDISVSAKLAGKGIDDGLKKAAETASQLSAILDQSLNKDLGTLNVSKFNKALSESKMDLRQVQASLAGAGNTGITAFNSIQSQILGTNLQLKNSSKLLDDMATSLKNTVKWGISSTIFNTMASSLQKAYSYSVNLDKSLNDIRIVTDASADKMEQFAKTANEASKNLGASTLDYTNAALIYYQQGLSDLESQQKAEITVKTANVTGQTGEEVSEQLTAVWNGYKVSAEESELYIDKLAAVAASTASDLEELSTGMSKVASAASLMGVDVDQLNATLATVISVTRQAPESVGTAFKTIYARMGDIEAGLDTETTLGDYTEKVKAIAGVNVLDANGQLRDMGEIIEEVGNKWTDMSREQQIALSQAMAGTRQYNNLLSLFDNWDMYEDALKTSKDASGELDRQNEIYLESIQAHTEQLKATWQDLYEGLINEGEVNTGIDVLKDFVQVLDNFVDSFGGGAKAITAFGAVISNVLNKQISESIGRLVQNQKKASDNLRDLQQKAEALRIENDRLGKDATPQQLGQQAAVDIQLEQGRKINSVKTVLSTDQYNQLTENATKMADLERQATVLDQMAEKQAKLNQLELESLRGSDPQGYLQTLDDEVEKRKIAVEITESHIKAIEKQLENEKELEGALGIDTELYIQLDSLMDSLNDDGKSRKDTQSQVTEATKEELKSAINELANNKKILKNEKDVAKEKEKILALIKKISQEEKKSEETAKNRSNAGRDIVQSDNQAEELRYQKNKIKDENDTTLNAAADAVQIAERVTAVTSTLSTLATTWSTINSMFQIWNDENATFAEKMSQSFMTSIMVVGQMASLYRSLNNLQSVQNALQAQENITKELGVAINLRSIKGKTTEQVIDLVQQKQKKKGNVLSKEEIALKLQKMGLLPEEIAGETALTGVRVAETGATMGLVGAVKSLTAALWASPLGPVLIALTAATAVISAVVSATEKYNKALREKNDKEIESQNTIQKQIDSNEELYQSFEKVKSGYEEGTSTKEELNATIDNLIDNLQKELETTKDATKETQLKALEEAKLTNNYEKATEAVKKLREEEAKRGLQSAEDERKAAGSNTTQTAKTKNGYQLGESYNVTFDGWNLAGSNNEETKANKILNSNISNKSWITRNSNDFTGASTNLKFDFNAENMVKLYDDLSNAKKQMDSEMSDAEIASSGIYKETSEWLEKMKDDVEKYKAAVGDVQKYSTQLDAAKTDFSKVNDLDSFNKARSDFINNISNDKNFKGKSQDEINEIANTYLSGQSDEYKRYIQKNKTIDNLTNIFGQDKQKEIKSTISGMSNEDFDILYTAGVDEIKSDDNFDTYMKKIKAKINSEHIKLQIENADSAINSILEGKELTDKQITSLKSLEKEYTQLGMIQDKNSSQYAEALIQIREELEAQAIAAEAAVEAASIEKVQQTLDNVDETVDINAQLNTEDFRKQLIEVAEQDYNVIVSVKADIQTDFDSIITTMDRMEEMASKIGDDFIVAAEDLEELNDVFPGISESMNMLGDGTTQLNQQIVTESMETAQQTLENDTKSTVGKLQNQRDILLSNADSARKIAEMAHGLAKNEELNAETKANISKELENIKKNNTEINAQYEKDSQKDVADTSKINSETMATNFAGAYKKMAEDSQKWAEAAKKNMLVATTGQGKTTAGNIVGQYSGSKNGQVKTTAKQGELQDGSQITSTTDWKAVEEYYTNLARNYTAAANNTQGKIAEILARTNQFNTRTSNISRGTGSDGKASSSKDSDSIDAIEDERDRYHDVDIVLKEIQNDMDILDKQKDKLLGSDLIANIDKQIGLLDQQIETTQQKIGIALGEMSELQGKLSGKGVSFNSDGTIANYASAYQAQLAYVNSLIAQYNSMSAEAKEGFKDTVEKAKDDFKTFTDNINRYDTLITDTIPGLQEDIQDALDEKIALQVEEFNMDIEISLDIKKAQETYNEFKRKILDDIDDEDILGNALSKLSQFGDYYNAAGNGVIQKETEHLNQLLGEIQKYNTTGLSDVYRDNAPQMYEDLQKYYEEAFNSLEEIEDLVDAIKDSLVETFDDIADQMDEQLNYYDALTKSLEHDMELVKLVYGEESYNQLAKYYNQQTDNINSQIEFQKQQVDFWKAQMDSLEEGTEAWESARDKWMDAVDDWQSKVEDAIKNLQDKYLNAINAIFQNLNNQITKGSGLDYVSTQWDLINKNADQYLDTINATYGIQQLQAKYLQAIDDTDSISAQRKLRELMDQQVTALKEQDKLTEYDLERAELKYQIALKQIALEEAQQNKSQMRLRRDSQGNYSYQYVADNDQVSKLQEEISNLYNQLYNLDTDRYTQTLNQVYDIWVEFQEKMAEAAQINDPQARADKELLLQQQYGELINGIVAQNETVKQNLHESTFLELEDLYGRESDMVLAFLQNENETMGFLVDGWTSALQEMADAIKDEGGFDAVYKETFEELTEATQQYEDDLDELQESAQVNFEEIASGIDGVIDETQDLIQSNGDLTDSFYDQADAIKGVIDQVEQLTKDYNDMAAAAKKAADEAYNQWLQQQRREQEAAAKKAAQQSSGNAGSSSGSSSSRSSGGSSSGGGNGQIAVGKMVTYTGGYYYSNSYGGGSKGQRGVGKQVQITQYIPGRPFPIHVKSSDSAYGWLKQSQITGYDTGGYTGDWGDNSGRLALLHQKEIVLNKEDTKNLLNTVEIMRNLTQSLGGALMRQLASLSPTSMGFGLENSALEQDVHIEASFPNVSSSNEIETALNNLVNAAAQRANQR